MMRLLTASVLIFGLTLLGCDQSLEPPPSYLLFPAGRSFLGASDLSISVNGNPLPIDTIYDGDGGYWLRVEQGRIQGKGSIEVEYTRRSGPASLFKGTKVDQTRWLTEAPYIDCEQEIFKTKALALTQGVTSRVEKARLIQKFVAGHVKLQVYRDSFLEDASKTYELGYGTCMNFSRLFIALCRSINIPARSVWGVIYGYNNDSVYDYHHQWAEVLDEDGYWHTADFSYTQNFDANDVRYLDLLYAAEENDILSSEAYEVHLGDVTFFNHYPAALTGRLGFELMEDHRPEYMKVRYVYKL
jgi:hypothetical protein